MSSISSIRRIALTAVVAFAVLSCHSLLSQASEASSTHDDVVAQLSGAENHWRATVVDPKTQHDSVPPSIREARNILWKPLLEQLRDTESDTSTMTTNSGAPPFRTDISLDPKETWVVATFDHYLVIPIDAEEKLFYTEIIFRINLIIRQPKTLSLTPDMTFDVDVAGGRIKKANGDIESWRLVPRRYSPQPEHSYLMMVEPLNAGGLYNIQEMWDLSSGKAVPDSEGLSCRDGSGRQVICGQPTHAAIDYLQSALPVDSSK